MIEEIQNIKSNKKELRSFGIIVGSILTIIAGILFYKENPFCDMFFYFGAIFIFLGIFLYQILKPFYIIWMTFAVIIGWFMTRLILSILFYSIMLIIAIIAKIVGKDFLYLQSNNNESYWNLRDKDQEYNQDYEKQF
tara:strand:- start:722 stop:1132 length:411 start_codon:yes stop_codon:yes gene_type:complete